MQAIPSLTGFGQQIIMLARKKKVQASPEKRLVAFALRAKSVRSVSRRAAVFG